MEVLITENWNKFLDLFNIKRIDIYYYEEYVKLYEDEKSKALCIVCIEDERVLLMPYIRKEVDGYYDFETAYGYGGPITNCDSAEWIDRALDKMAFFFKKEKYVCGFIRFHPILENVKICEGHMTTIFDRKTVAINTDNTEDEIWQKQIISKNRNMIRKAERNGLEFKPEYDFSSIKDFAKLYNDTMSRLNADEFYFFNPEYFQLFVKNFKGRAFLGTVRKGEELICAALFMYLGKYGHYHLEGSNHTYSGLAANNYLLWNTALELKKLGVKEFHLGGGYDAEPDNSLLKFKKAFSSNMKEFYIGKWIFNDRKYDELKMEWCTKYPEKVEKYGKLLLCYRY